MDNLFWLLVAAVVTLLVQETWTVATNRGRPWSRKGRWVGQVRRDVVLRIPRRVRSAMNLMADGNDYGLVRQGNDKDRVWGDIYCKSNGHKVGSFELQPHWDSNPNHLMLEITIGRNPSDRVALERPI